MNMNDSTQTPAAAQPRTTPHQTVSASRWARVGASIGLAWRRFTASLANLRRRVFRSRLPNYVVLTLDGPMRDLPPVSPWWMRFVPGFQRPLSLYGLRSALRRIAGDPDIAGVVLLVKGLELKRTHGQNLSALIDRFREWEKEHRDPDSPPRQVIVWMEQAGATEYLATCKADRIYIAPLATWEVIGLRVEAHYYRDALARLGLHAEVVRVAPWKTAADQFAESSMSPEARAQYTWLLDSLYEETIQTIATGRKLEPERVRALIDSAPLSAQEALAAGLVDGICYEDELESLLQKDDEPALLKTYADVRRLLKRHARPRAESRVGVLDLSGTIISGESRTSPVPLPLMGDAILGSSSAQQAIRTARLDDGIAAVVAYVDSPGGSALASDLIERELRLLAQEKPLVVYMGPVAASGGYYISAPASHIVAQQGTLTGSIGVVTAKLITEDAFAKWSIGRDSVQRGAHAALYSDAQAWTEGERARIEAGVDLVYTTFKQRVVSGRQLEATDIEMLAGGRVWTGEQAMQRGLVDSLGDFESAVERAAHLAGIRKGVELRLDFLPLEHAGLLAEPASAAAWAVAAKQTLAALQTLAAAQNPAEAAAGASLALRVGAEITSRLDSALRRERIWMIADSLPRIQ